jgi:lysyl-tRNA synthetase, class I
VRYFADFVAPKRVFRLPTDAERAAMGDLRAALAAFGASGAAPEDEALMSLVRDTGKAHGYENLRDWFKAIYEVVLGSSEGPRLGSFIALYGVAETEALLARALAGDFVA